MRSEQERSTEPLQVALIKAAELLSQEIATIRRLVERRSEMMSEHEQPTPEPLQIPLAQAAQLLSYNSRTIRTMIARRDLESTGEGRGLRVTMKSIRNYIETKSSSGRR